MIRLNSIVYKTLTSSALAVTAIAATASAAVAETTKDFIVNGGFEQATQPTGQLESIAKVTGWNATDAADFSKIAGLGYDSKYVFLTNAESASNPGLLTTFGKYERLSGPGNGFDNGFDASPQGGNFIAMDAWWRRGALTQIIDGLIVGETYKLSFAFAYAQNSGATTATTHSLTFGMTSDPTKLGSYTTTPTVKNPLGGFVDWTNYTFEFIADNSSSYLYFLANGAPSGQPPFSLLDNVSLTGPHAAAVPEPATWAMMIMGFGAIGGIMRRRVRERRLAM